jgi:hypothetical protein
LSFFDDFLANHRRLERLNVPAAVEMIIATAPFGADRQDRQRPRVPKNLLARIVDVISDQATELESLRDGESQPAPRVIATEADLAELPERSVIIGADHRVHQLSINSTDSTGLRFWDVPGSDGYYYHGDVVLPATLIHTPTEGTPS